MDVSSVTAVTAATTQSAGAPVTIDAVFGALLQSMTEAEPTAVAAPLIQSAALAMVFPTDNPTGQQPVVQQTSEQQDNAAATPSPQMPSPFAPIAPTIQTTASQPLPSFPQQGASAISSQQSMEAPQAEIPQSAAWPAAPQTSPVPVQTGAQANDGSPPPPTTVTASQPATAVQPPVPQQAMPSAPQGPQSEQNPSIEPPLPEPTAPAPDPTPAQVAVKATASQPQTAEPAPPSNASDVADLQIATPAPRDPAPATTKPAAPKAKIAAEEPKHDDTTNTNTIVDVLAGFLLPQIEPLAAPANDTTADTVDPAASTKNDDQGVPVVAATDQDSTAPAQPMPVAVPLQIDGQIAAAAVDQTSKDNAPAPAAPIATQDNAAPAAPKPTTKQQASRQTTEHSDNQPVFIPANDTAPDSRPEAQPKAAAEVRTPLTPDAPQPAQANATNPAPQQVPVANPAIPLIASSGLRKLTAGLRVAAQEQDTTSSIDKLGLTIATKSIDGLRHFDIRLDPPELGRVQVQLTTDDTGRTQASVVVDKPQTLDLLQRDAQNLNRALNEAGLDVSNNGLNFSLREQYRQNDGGVDQGRGRSLSAQAVMQTDATEIHSSLGSYAPNSVRLDIRV